MSIIIDHGHGAQEQQALEELRRDGFVASVVDYEPGRTEPHSHDYDICLHIIDGVFELAEVEQGIVHRCGPGTKLFVGEGTRHFENHGELRMVVGGVSPARLRQAA